MRESASSNGTALSSSWSKRAQSNGGSHLALKANGGSNPAAVAPPTTTSASKAAAQSPTTWIGVAAMHLAQHDSSVVYLLPVGYIQNWINWACHVDPSAHERLRIAAVALGLTPPPSSSSSSTTTTMTTATAAAPSAGDAESSSFFSHFHDPGPIDASPLSVEGHPLVLSPFVRLHSIDEDDDDAAIANGFAPLSLSRVVSANARGDRTAAAGAPPTASKGGTAAADHKPSLFAVAVPEPFYEMLRASHGVVCDDGHSLSFQPPVEQRSALLLHHHLFGEDAAPVDDCRGRGGGGGGTHASSPMSALFYPRLAAGVSRPIEFRRNRIMVIDPASVRSPSKDASRRSLMERLLAEEPRYVVQVEVHPLKITYTVAAAEDDDATPVLDEASSLRLPTPRGYCLISRRASAGAAFKALLRAAAPTLATPQVRLWMRREYPASPTPEYPYEYDAVASPDDLPGAMEELFLPSRTSSNVLVEVRRSVNADWPLHRHDLSARLRVGDFCDAQDVAGKWYEAMVVETILGGGSGTDESGAGRRIKVHYMGWAKKWDATLLVNQSPSPLWSRTSRWRESIKVGAVVEVRDSSSLAERPKWYKGVVRHVGRKVDEPRPLVGGAELETHQGRHLLLLGQTQQVLVEVEQEKNSVTPALIKKASSTIAEDGGIEPHPPYLRWVNLYGEEICKLGTHLKEDSSAPVTLRYECDATRKPVEVLKGHGAGFMRESLRGTPPAPGSIGLQNLGNSCYMNGIVQCLNHIEPLTQYFLRDAFMPELNRSNPLGSGGNVTMAYAYLLKKMWSGEYCILAPRALKQTVASFAPQFDNSYQHDSHEFCQFLMDGLHEDLNRVKTKPYVEELEGFGMEDETAAIESWRKHLLRHDSIIVDHCQGMHRSHLTCPRCGRESIKFDIFSSISLPLITNKNQTRIKLEDCLEKFMEGEQLDERNAWYCPNCRQHVCALKMIALWSVPDILILHLKRFTFDTCMTSGGMLRSKIDNTVDFPIDGLDLTNHVLGPKDPDAPPIYSLFGVSEHTGPTANSGHYTATVRNSIDGQWYRCNDSHIGHTSGEASITGDAYLLFYQRKRGISKWGGMEKVMREKKIDPYGGLLTDQQGFTKVSKKKKKK